MKKSSCADLLAVDELVVKEKEVPLLRVAFGDFVQLAAVDHLCAGFHYIWTLHAGQEVRVKDQSYDPLSRLPSSHRFPPAISLSSRCSPVVSFPR